MPSYSPKNFKITVSNYDNNKNAISESKIQIVNYQDQKQSIKSSILNLVNFNNLKTAITTSKIWVWGFTLFINIDDAVIRLFHTKLEFNAFINLFARGTSIFKHKIETIQDKVVLVLNAVSTVLFGKMKSKAETFMKLYGILNSKEKQKIEESGAKTDLFGTGLIKFRNVITATILVARWNPLSYFDPDTLSFMDNTTLADLDYSEVGEL